MNNGKDKQDAFDHGRDIQEELISSYFNKTV